MKLKLVFTDLNGKRYYQNERGDIVRKDGSLVSTTEEMNVKAMLGERNTFETYS